MQLLGFKTYSLHTPKAPHEKENFQGGRMTDPSCSYTRDRQSIPQL